MKRKLFICSSSLFINVLLLTFVIASCTKKTSDLKQSAIPEEVATSASGNSAALQAVALAVTVDPGYGIIGDGSVYANGSQNVQAIIDKNGNFVFNTNTKYNLTPTRALSFDFTPNSSPPLISSKSYTLETVASTVLSFTPLQNLVINQPYCISFRVLAISGNTINWRAVYHAGFDDRTESTTAFAQVIKTDATHWTITSLGTCLSAIADQAAYRGGNSNDFYGYYSLPFSVKLAKL